MNLVQGLGDFLMMINRTLVPPARHDRKDSDPLGTRAKAGGTRPPRSAYFENLRSGKTHSREGSKQLQFICHALNKGYGRLS